MDRDQKAALVEEITSSLNDAEAIFAVDYRGISVTQAAELRTRLSEADASFRVVKNRLAKLAAESAGTAELVEVLEGPTALTFVKGDPVTAAKALATFGREHRLLEFKGGLMEGAAVDPEQFKAIARLPGLEILRSQLVGVAASPITGLARGLGAMLSGLALALGQVQEQGLVAGEAEQEAAEPAPEEPSGEEPAAEEPAAGEPAAEVSTSDEPEPEDEPEAQSEPEAEAGAEAESEADAPDREPEDSTSKEE